MASPQSTFVGKWEEEGLDKTHKLTSRMCCLKWLVFVTTNTALIVIKTPHPVRGHILARD